MSRLILDNGSGEERSQPVGKREEKVILEIMDIDNGKEK